jgi:hypothetical protein
MELTVMGEHAAFTRYMANNFTVLLHKSEGN